MIDLQELHKDLKMSVLELASIGLPTASYRFWTATDIRRATAKVAERLANWAASIEQEERDARNTG
uniref:Uncharacterized protein n=1 Tax=viral metagenome TaxID=1070528 RepID=A0A6M3KXG1_9ZZZZ